MKTLTLIILLFPALSCFGQTQEDSLSTEEVFESIAGDTAYLTTQSDTAYSGAQYTQRPEQLSATQEELQKKYTSRKFSKTEWKRIVGETNYAEEAEKAVNPMPNVPWNPFILKVIGYIIIFGLITFLIILFVKQALKDSDKKIRKEKEAALFSDQTTPEALEEIDLEKLLQEALAQNNLRLAVRLYYIKLLKHLNREGYIRWEKNKTNREYAEELGRAGFSREFRRLMIAYEYVWYGNRTPSVDEFNTIESNFKTLYKAQRA